MKKSNYQRITKSLQINEDIDNMNKKKEEKENSLVVERYDENNKYNKRTKKNKICKKNQIIEKNKIDERNNINKKNKINKKNLRNINYVTYRDNKRNKITMRNDIIENRKLVDANVNKEEMRNEINCEFYNNYQNNELAKNYESSENFLNSDSFDSSNTDISINMEETDNINGFVEIFENIDYGNNPTLSTNYEIRGNPDLVETFEIYDIFESDNNLNNHNINSNICNNNENEILNNQSSDSETLDKQSRDSETLDKQSSDNDNDNDNINESDVEKIIIEDKLSKNLLLYFPFFKKRIFIDAIIEHFQKEELKNIDKNCLKVQYYEIIKEIYNYEKYDINIKNKKLLNEFFCEKLNNKKYDMKLEIDYYEFEFFSIFFLSYFRFSLYLSGFINSSFLYHSNEIHFHIFVLNRYHYFVDNFYLNDTSPFTYNEVNEIISTYKNSIISILDYLDAFYPFFLLIYNIIRDVHIKSKKTTSILEKNEVILKNNFKEINKRNCVKWTRGNSSSMSKHVIHKFDLIKKINKIKRNFFKDNYDKFVLMIIDELNSFWLLSCIYEKENDIKGIDSYLKKFILNIKNNMLIKYIIYNVVKKLNVILSKLEKKCFENWDEICKRNIISISTLLNFESLKKVKKKDKWLLLLKQNYYYIEKSYYFFKELHEKKIIYHQIQNLFRSILNFKINVVYNHFIQYFYVRDIKNKKIDTIYDYIYYIKSKKNTLITLFAYKRLIYKLKFDVNNFGLVNSIYNSLKFLFMERESVNLIKKNTLIKKKFMYLFNKIINSLNFEKYKYIDIPTKNIIKNILFHSENNIVKNILLNVSNKITRIRCRGDICCNTSFSCYYEREINEELFNVLKNNKINKLDKNYLTKEIKKFTKELKINNDRKLNFLTFLNGYKYNSTHKNIYNFLNSDNIKRKKKMGNELNNYFYNECIYVEKGDIFQDYISYNNVYNSLN
ncbi:conserved Plasmodium protein, unknown function [Plasmodium gallinaceum]|uniref:Uncharacterized protein n=1 Tax=Plasmodium gallinaceum TaxID=5849 RepID=A0A1J1H426_PLAGA|nr:conserved Plasmodium protein, unknown function [Plasmodium gallinaceum]CRG98106.1 conserved Plasmodium protein, unknown function [Plasmodium gallinaceum]